MSFSKVIFTTSDNILQELIIAELYNMPGISGFEETAEALLVYGDPGIIDREALDKIAEERNIAFEMETLEERNWNEEWERNFEPVSVDDFCYIRADFHPANTGAQHEIIITPKMSFGTGHHATTQMMITLMRHTGFGNKKVLDFGTGTGVLAILAARLGAEEIVAVDHDTWSYENALENCSNNHSEKIKVLEGTLDDVPATGFDIILANINRNILLQYMPAMAQMLSPGGILLLSGILAGADEPAIIQAAADHHLQLVKSITKDKWEAMYFQK